MLVNLNEAIELIKSNKLLHIAADDSLLKQLPSGNWIGGTTPYFIAGDGGTLTKEKLYVNEISNVVDFKISTYNADTIMSITQDTYDNGYSLIILPFGSNVLLKFSKDAPNIENMFLNNVVGWVSGYDLSDSDAVAKVYNGQTGGALSDDAVVLHVSLPADKLATVGIVNIFEQDKDMQAITFETNGLEAEFCIIDGNRVNFAQYINENKIDTKLPLVADYMGNGVNISIKSMEDNIVKLYAPVFNDMTYYFAKPVENYVERFSSKIKELKDANPGFSCNCILNYLYGDLDGEKTLPFEGPVTFGEVAFQLVNQTLVYLVIV